MEGLIYAFAFLTRGQTLLALTRQNSCIHQLLNGTHMKLARFPHHEHGHGKWEKARLSPVWQLSQLVTWWMGFALSVLVLTVSKFEKYESAQRWHLLPLRAQGQP